MMYFILHVLGLLIFVCLGFSEFFLSLLFHSLQFILSNLTESPHLLFLDLEFAFS